MCTWPGVYVMTVDAAMGTVSVTACETMPPWLAFGRNRFEA